MHTRRRLTGVATAVSAVVLVAASALVLVLFQRQVLSSADDLARGRAADLATLAADSAVPALLADIGDDAVGQVIGPDGSVLAASDGLTGAPAITDVRSAGDEAVQVDLDDVPDDDETEDYRAWVVTEEGPDGSYTAVVGASRESIREDVVALGLALLVAMPLVLVAAGGLLWLLLGRTLRPVEEAHRRQRAFVADAAHELQSPLAAYRAQLEVAQRHDDPKAWREVAADLLADTDRMERLVRDLLFLARQDSSPVTGWTLVDLDDVVLEEVARVRPGTTVVVDTGGVSAAPVRGSRDDLARMVGNLLANGVRHARVRVEVACHQDESGTLLVVADDGAGIEPALRETVFERFRRGDPARTHGAGTGLGLSIARAVAERHGGTVRIGESDGGARFEVRLPRA
ncbi:sensor histidine kinase [Nocardioides zhouii]|uniref:histidine kinase n=1 Tax=Nocardioides zhouii TaxID=1168729 RepID=A0A4Q2SIG2_9ACTN|nr:HAMP domain-containing sensor histidine kinase [Nocardioides zhouii]RYC05326.1 HAMP domain-containing histidine kinase [Nocardioides zhouii]